MTEHLVNFYFIVVDKLFIGITRYGVICIDSWEKYRLSFNKTSLKLAIHYLLDNSYFTLGIMCFP